ncbi:hypothetical protein NL676_017943 [Syzygium grande]|nr:hypothetical protein NL676_017943 [Syzygium grande]
MGSAFSRLGSPRSCDPPPRVTLANRRLWALFGKSLDLATLDFTLRGLPKVTRPEGRATKVHTTLSIAFSSGARFLRPPPAQLLRSPPPPPPPPPPDAAADGAGPSRRGRSCSGSGAALELAPVQFMERISDSDSILFGISYS